MKAFVRNRYEWIIGILAVGMLAAAIFSVNGAYDTRIDAPIYAAQIDSFSQGDVISNDPAVMLRLFKPLYAIVAGSIFHASNAYVAILILNLLFCALLAFSSYQFLRALEYSKSESVIGMVWTLLAYPVFKYGLALGTDISGWALAATTIALGTHAIRKDSNFMLSLASVVGFLGAAAKETGVLGLGGLCIAVIWIYRKRGIKTLLVKILSAGLPALVLYGVLFATIAGAAPSFLDWFSANSVAYSGERGYSRIKLILVEGSTFNLYWLAVIYALWRMIKNRQPMPHFDIVIALGIATLPILAWPLAISRITFIQFLWVIPLVVYGYREFISVHLPLGSSLRKKMILASIICVPILFNMALFLASAGGSLFTNIRL